LPHEFDFYTLLTVNELPACNNEKGGKQVGVLHVLRGRQKSGEGRIGFGFAHMKWNEHVRW